MWDQAACCPQPQPHNGALVHDGRRPAGSASRPTPGSRALLCGVAAPRLGSTEPDGPGLTALGPGYQAWAPSPVWLLPLKPVGRWASPD